MPGMPHDVEESDATCPALDGEHPVSRPGIVGNVAFTAKPDVEAVEGVVKNGQPNPKQLQVKNKREAGEQFNLLGVSTRPSSSECIGNEMLDQERAYRDDAAEGMQLAQQERTSMTGSQRSNAFRGADGSSRTGGCRHETPCEIRDDKRTFYYLVDREGKSRRAAVTGVFDFKIPGQGVMLA